MTLATSKPKPTNKSNSCPVCGDTKGKCRTFADSPVVLCGNTAKGSEPSGWSYRKPASNPLWSVFAPNDERSSSDNWQEQLEARNKRNAGRVAEAKRLATLKPVEQRDREYRAKPRTLAQERFQSLTDRGLTSEETQFAIDQHWIWDTDYGFAIAALSLDGKIQGCQIARDDRKPKYIWDSTNQSAHIPATGENPLFIWIHPQCDRTKPIRLISLEGAGKPLYAALKHWRSGDYQAVFVGAAGGIFGQKSLTALLTELKPESVQYAPDAGWSNAAPNVIAGAQTFIKGCQKLDIEPSVIWWGQATKPGKDIDELSAAEFASARRLSWVEFKAIAETFQPVAPETWLQRITRVLKRRSKPTDSAVALRRDLGEIDTQIFEYEEGDRLATWKQASEQGYRCILDQSQPGTGKSHDTGLLTPAEFGAEKAFYISIDRRNSTVPTLAEWQEVEARHNGLTIDSAGKLRRRKDGQNATVDANCSRVDAIAVLRSKNVQGADRDTVCQTCPVAQACKFSIGGGYGFKFQRRQALSADRLRIHPASLPDVSEDFSYSGTINIWDEASASIQNSRAIVASVADLDQLISRLACQAPQQFIQLQPLLSGLKSLITGDQPRYGFTYHDVLKALPTVDFDALDWTSLLEALKPDLSGLEPPDEVDLDQIAAKDRRGLGWVKRSLTRETAQSQFEQTKVLEQTVLKQWFSEFLGVLNGDIGDIRINHGKLTLTLPDDRHRAIIRASKVNVFLDGTSSRKDVALKLGCRPDEIFVCRQRLPKLNNLTVTQVTDLGGLSQQRGEDKQRRATAIDTHCQTQDPTAKVIDFKKFEADGAWWRDSRGVNDFLDTKTLVLIGTPIANIAHLLAEYSVLTDTHPTEEDADFQTYVDRNTRAEFHQAIGRLRANRRPNEQLEIVILSDFDLGIPTNKVKASQITLEATGKRERFEMAFKAAANQLKANGEKLTQTAIAKLTDYSQQYLSRYWKLLLTLLETPYRKSSKNSDPPPELITSLAEGIDAAVNQFCETPDEVLETINEAFFELIEPDQQSQFWQALKTQTQIRILEVLALTLPLNHVELAIA